MTKEQRISELEAKVDLLLARIALLEQKVNTVVYQPPAQWIYQPPNQWTPYVPPMWLQGPTCSKGESNV